MSEVRVSVNDWITIVDKEKLKRLCEDHPQITYHSKHNDAAGTSRRVSYICKSAPRYLGVKVKRTNVKLPPGAVKDTLSSYGTTSRYGGMSSRRANAYRRNRPPKAENVCPEDEDPDGLPLIKPTRTNYSKKGNVKTC